MTSHSGRASQGPGYRDGITAVPHGERSPEGVIAAALREGGMNYSSTADRIMRELQLAGFSVTDDLHCPGNPAALSGKIRETATRKGWTADILLRALLAWFDDREDSGVGPAPGETEITEWLEEKG